MNSESGQDLVSDFYSDIKGRNGSRFEHAFKYAVKMLSRRIHGYWTTKGIQRKSYQTFDREILQCLEKNLESKQVIEITATCMFAVLHDQNGDI